jgi:hypothetical protein
MTSNTPGLADFRDPRVFLNAKGSKLQFKANSLNRAVLDVMHGFQASLERIIDLRFVDKKQFYVDVGKQSCCNVCSLTDPEADIHDEAQVYCWKRCCLEHYIEWLYDGEPPAKATQGQQYFGQNMLHDAAGLTSVTPKRSRHRKGGLIYSQFYSSVKEVSDAAKCNPFDNEVLEELALDPQIRHSARQITGQIRRDTAVLVDAYKGSKHRAHEALRGSRKKSFGILEEHRLSWVLFERLIHRFEVQGGQIANPLSGSPTYAWSIQTSMFLDFLWHSVNKFAAGYEIVRARCRQELVTWEQTKMMTMFLRCLWFVLTSRAVQRDSALWWGRHERPGGRSSDSVEVVYGLGFSKTLPKHKYCWLEPIFDWHQLVFLPRLQRGGRIEDFFGATRQIDLALEWIGRYGTNVSIREGLLAWMAHACLRQFRMDVLSTLKDEIPSAHAEEVMQSNTYLCFEYLREIIHEKPHLISGNRCAFKHASAFAKFLFDFDDGRLRTHWEHRKYRKLYHRARRGLQSLPAGTTLARFFAHLAR